MDNLGIFVLTDNICCSYIVSQLILCFILWYFEHKTMLKEEETYMLKLTSSTILGHEQL